MKARARFSIVGLLAFAIPWSAPVLAVAQPDEAARVERLLTAIQESEQPPVQKKPHTSVFEPLGMYGFSAALLLGETQGGSTPENLPVGAKKALADLRDFLPYKNYRLLDTQWIRCCAGPNIGGRLRGLDEQLYTFHVGISSVSGTKMTANFSLIDEDSHVAAFGKKSIINSNFSMETGETVVIGTSSLKGDKALVVLLTAVPRSTTNATKKGSGQ